MIIFLIHIKKLGFKKTFKEFLKANAHAFIIVLIIYNRFLFIYIKLGKAKTILSLIEISNYISITRTGFINSKKSATLAILF